MRGRSATMRVRLHVPAETQPRTVLVLVPGSTYNSAYWDFPYEPDTYSFRLAMNRAGFATLLVDRIGTAESSRPSSLLVTSSLQARGVHEAIRALRAGELGVPGFERVVIAGHSQGSAIAVIESALHRDVDAVLLTGFSHSLNPVGLVRVFAKSYRRPAFRDSRFRGRGYGPAYLTSVPGTRGWAFYEPRTADPAVVAEDERTKDVITIGELADGIVRSVMRPLSRRIEVPVLIVLGTRDRFFGNRRICASASAFQRSESRWFTGSPSFEVELMPDAGHGLNLSRSAPALHERVLRWLDDRVQ
jgi:pimeloyl-ACP methyl ester carboxylesterase